jgi:hypothetical protein
MVVVSAEQGAPTLEVAGRGAPGRARSRRAADPLVKAVLARFPGAEIVGVRGPDAAAEAPADNGYLSPDARRKAEAVMRLTGGLPAPEIERLIQLLARLPGLGRARRGARRCI